MAGSVSAPRPGPGPEEFAARLEESELLLQIGTELSGQLEISQVLDLALRRAERLCRAETSSIWELDRDAGELFFHVVRGRAADEIRDLRVPLGQGIVGSVASSGVAEVVNDVASDPRWSGDASGGFRTRAILAVPLAVQGQVVGVLQMLNPVDQDGFTERDLRRMELFGRLVAHAVENARLHAAERRRFAELATALAEAIEKRDPYTGGHVHRVVAYSLLLAERLGFSPEDLERLRLAATLHDVGKIAVPDQVLGKPGHLNDAERRVMERHPEDGADIVGRISGLADILPGVRHHHERLDGGGYPDGLEGEEIPLQARIIAVADTWDAMTTSRPYRQALPPREAAREIERCSGTQFCPRVVTAFGELVREGEFTVDAGRRILELLSPRGERR